MSLKSHYKEFIHKILILLLNKNNLSIIQLLNYFCLNKNLILLKLKILINILNKNHTIIIFLQYLYKNSILIYKYLSIVNKLTNFLNIIHIQFYYLSFK